MNNTFLLLGIMVAGIALIVSLLVNRMNKKNNSQSNNSLKNEEEENENDDNSENHTDFTAIGENNSIYALADGTVFDPNLTSRNVRFQPPLLEEEDAKDLTSPYKNSQLKRSRIRSGMDIDAAFS